MAARARPRDVHDRLVKRVYSRNAAFAVELRRVLPPPLLGHVDLRTLARYATERTDERLRGRMADLCFTAGSLDCERRGPIYFPLEHYSTPSKTFPLRALACASELWHEHLADHPQTTVLPLVAPIVLVQPPARSTPTRLSTVLDVPDHLRDPLVGPIEVRAYVDDLSGSVLDDPEADAATLALVELTRAFLYAYGNPGSLTEARLATLMPLFDVLLDQPEPLATHDVRALMTYLLSVFEPGSPVRMLVEDTLSRRSRTMFISMADSLVAQGRSAGLAEGCTAGIARAVLRVLERRSLSIPEPVRERVASSRDEQQLLRWLDRAVTAASVDDVLGDLDG
jgi:hypothetical protein